MKTPKFFDLKELLKKEPDGDYYIIYGERSNGKTFSVKEYALERYLEGKGQLAVIRRWREDFRGKNSRTWLDDLKANIYRGNIIEKLSKGKWNDYVYDSGRWYLCHTDKDGNRDRKDDDYFAAAFALTDYEHDKSSAYPNISTVLFDEFISKMGYLQDEFTVFLGCLSTIVRLRDDLKIIMCGNTINRYCIYFDEMGLRRIKNQKKGTIDRYTAGQGSATIITMYADFPITEKKSNKYFTFDNPKLKMITEGAWEISPYPHLPATCRYLPKDIEYTYFILFDGECFQCEIIYLKNDLNPRGVMFTYIHRKTTPIRDDGKAVIYQQVIDPRPNYSMRINHPVNDIQKAITGFFVANKVFYQDNMVGDTIHNYLDWCEQQGV